ncbi:hypothetical protein O6H91_Y170000 [Diphasiastrum complanatum]|nr:hypothetical protein O6H91_Y170000 [Diphasiastrum complanatum]KAJ7295695.1 hypothetical protein O6H91_Y170000 [Diphasiastrum complanatum]
MPIETKQKKRKTEDKDTSSEWNNDDLKTLLDTLTKEHLVNLLQDAALRHSDILKDVRKTADKDPVPRKLFVRGLGWDTKAEAMQKVLSKFGEIEEAVVVSDRKTQKGRGYGFVTFVHLDSALRALKDPNNTIEGRVTVCHLASQGSEPAKHATEDVVTHRKIYVSNVPEDFTSEKLHKFFSQYGEIAEGPLGFDKSGKSRGFSLIVYQALEGAKKALEDPVKIIDGHKMRCKLAEGGPRVKEPSEAKEGGQSVQPFLPSYGSGVIGGYGIPLDPSALSSGLALNPGFANSLSNSYANLSSLGLGASMNPSLYALRASMDPSLAANLYPISSDSMAQGLASGLGYGLYQAGGSVGLASLGAQSGGMASYPAQLAAYARLAALYDAGSSSASQGGAIPGSAIPSYSTAHLGATPAERARNAGALGSLGTYYDR